MQLTGSPDTIQAGHADVHEHDVGRQLAHRARDFGPVRAFAHHVETELLAQDAAQAGTDQLLVVDEQYADHCVAVSGRKGREHVRHPAVPTGPGGARAAHGVGALILASPSPTPSAGGPALSTSSP